MIDYSVVRYSPSTSRYHRLLEKLTVVLKERNVRIATIADYGSGVGFDPDNDLVNLLKQNQVGNSLTGVFAYDLIPEEYATQKEIEGIPLDYKKRNVSDGLFTSATEPKTDLSMSLSLLNHLQSQKRVDILEGMLRKTNIALLIAYGGAYGRNYWDEENPTKLLSRGRDGKHNGWFFIKNPQGGLDFIPLSTTK